MYSTKHPTTTMVEVPPYKNMSSQNFFCISCWSCFMRMRSARILRRISQNLRYPSIPPKPPSRLQNAPYKNSNLISFSMDINLCSASKALKASCVSLPNSNLRNSLGFLGLFFSVWMTCSNWSATPTYFESCDQTPSASAANSEAFLIPDQMALAVASRVIGSIVSSSHV